MSHRTTRQMGALERRKKDIKLYEGIVKSGVFPVELGGEEYEEKDIKRKLKLAQSEVKVLEGRVG